MTGTGKDGLTRLATAILEFPSSGAPIPSVFRSRIKRFTTEGIYGKGGLTSFAELFLDFNQDEVKNYRRSLNLNEAIAHVSYEKDGVRYQREYFASYPDNVIVIRLSADQKGALSFTVRPEIPYLALKQRKGKITATENLLTLKGSMPLFSCNFEGQIKVLNEGGSLSY